MLTQEYNSSITWRREDIISEKSNARSITKTEAILIRDALEYIDPYNKVVTTEKNISLLALEPLFDEIFEALTLQRGFYILKGLPSATEGYDPDIIKQFFLEFSRYLGTPLIQNKQNDLVFDVKSIEGLSFKSKDARGPQIKDAIPMHTDAGAILGMYCFEAADIGGETILASSKIVHDEIKSKRPDLLEVLYQPFYTDRRGNEPDGALPYDHSPIFAEYEGEIMCQYHQPFYADAHIKCPDLPAMSLKQREALEYFDKVSLDPNIAYKTKLPEGSIIFINNEKILHGRTSFDYPKSKSVRHLMRVWLETPKIPNTFPSFLGYPAVSV